VIVADASAVAELLLGLPGGASAEPLVFDEPGGAHAPSLIDAEVLHTIRRYERGAAMTAARALGAVEDLRDLPIVRYPLGSLIEAAWSLRHNLSAYDAFYVALAIALESRLVTTDRRMAEAVSTQVGIEVVAL
jgi:predicted nucleic acid-binding protein